MSISRYRNSNIKRIYSKDNEYIENRNIPFIDFKLMNKFKNLKLKDIKNILIETHLWESSDRYYKLADQYYGDSTYWWIIALYNKKPLEADISLGQKIYIPLPLEYILEAMEI